MIALLALALLSGCAGSDDTADSGGDTGAAESSTVHVTTVDCTALESDEAGHEGMSLPSADVVLGVAYCQSYEDGTLCTAASWSWLPDAGFIVLDCQDDANYLDITWVG